ncbi:hypothetical protein HDU76_003228 [Blyttiomyces sp. JEL0837]|nr:hypothetical protein HDU76_003228 [Blyttiomyces sp. JEL0837]
MTATELTTSQPAPTSKATASSVHEEIYDHEPHHHDRRVICIAVDESEYSDYAFQWALDNTVDKEDQVVLLNCRPYTINAADYSISGDFSTSVYSNKEWAETVEASQRQVSHDLLRKLGNRVLDKGIACRAIALRGDAREEIAAKVQEIKADMLVVGSRGLGAIKRAFLGSVSDYLVHHCHCAVILPRMPEPDATKTA